MGEEEVAVVMVAEVLAVSAEALLVSVVEAVTAVAVTAVAASEVEDNMAVDLPEDSVDSVVAVKEEMEVEVLAASEAALEVRALAVMVVVEVVSVDKELVVMVVAVKLVVMVVVVKLVVGLKEVLFRPLCKLNIP